MRRPMICPRQPTKISQLISAGYERKRLPYSALINRSEEHTSELQSRQYLVCRLLLEKKNSHRCGLIHHVLGAAQSERAPRFGDMPVVADVDVEFAITALVRLVAEHVRLVHECLASTI